MSIANAIPCGDTLRGMDSVQEWRRKRLASAAEKQGGKAELGRALGYKDGAFVGQMLRGERPITEKTVSALEAIRGYAGWFGGGPAAELKLSVIAAHGVSEPQPEYAGQVANIRSIAVVGTARMGDNGFYEEISAVVGAGDGTIDVFTKDPGAYALRVRGDSMMPAIRDGWYVVVEPNAQPTVGEYVLVKLRNGQKMVKELLYRRQDSIAVMSVNGDVRRTLHADEIEDLQAVSTIVSPSKWRP